MENKELIARAERFIKELGVTCTSFARNTGFATVTIHQWRSGRISLSKKAMERIDQYLSHYGF